jgi:hypothetical protein
MKKKTTRNAEEEWIINNKIRLSFALSKTAKIACRLNVPINIVKVLNIKTFLDNSGSTIFIPKRCDRKKKPTKNTARDIVISASLFGPLINRKKDTPNSITTDIMVVTLWRSKCNSGDITS